MDDNDAPVGHFEQSMEFRRLVIEHLPDFVVLLDREQRMIWVNRVAPGLRMQDVIGSTIEEFLSPETKAVAQRTIVRAFSEGVVGQFEAQGYGDGETQAWYLMRVVPIPSSAGVQNLLLLTSDITERKGAEHALLETRELLHKAQRQESIGQLAGGIAHDFNNLLQVLQGTLFFVQEGLKRGKVVTEELAQAVRATERAAELTSQLLAIGRRKHVDRKPVELAELVERTMKMLRRAIPENVALRHEPPKDRYFVELDVPQFEQVLINLCFNARDAMPTGGTLTVAVAPQGEAEVVLSVIDTGTGIPEAELSRVFEPFYTTKGAGSGLGLAVAAGIVAAHAGVIFAESESGQGTAMRVRLPRIEPTSDAPVGVSAPSPGGSEMILVAEDEEMVRAQMVRVLTESGYSVIEAENGARAVSRFRECPEEIDLVILDAIMPEMDGWQAYLELEKLRPGIKVLFSTGYAASVLPGDFAARGARLLSKPHRPAALLAHVRQMLEQSC